METGHQSPELVPGRPCVTARSPRARLRVFFGAAPGVGKTYSMLEAARTLQRSGLDVVVGWVDTHGRAETEALLTGLERLPVRGVEHRGIALREFALDAALARRPAVLLVDELAHTNAPGSRHAHRWQDVEELLDAGIDVFTTLNVQHLDSLNDVVAMVTGVAILETVPDSILERNAELELVDLPPDELLQRLREGKVYVPAQIGLAMDNFFRKGNLIVLRELALRRTAERVDAQVAEWKHAESSSRSWPSRERLLVAVGPAPQSANLVRATSRMATRLRAPWIALSVETPAFDRLPTADRDRVAEHLALAERLGAETLVVRGERPADEILAVAAERNVSRILAGKPSAWSWRERLRGSLVDELVRRSSGVEVLITTGEAGDERRPIPVPRRSAPPRREYLWALGAVAASTLLCKALGQHVSSADQAMIYLFGVLAVASRWSRRASLLAAVTSVAAFDFFFVPPYLTFDVAHLRHLITFVVMLVVGITVSQLTHRIRQQAEAARQRERRTAALFAMSRGFAAETEVSEIAATAERQIQDLLGVDVVVMVREEDGRLVPRGGLGSQLLRSEGELAVARWVFEHGRPAGHGTDTLPGSAGVFLPLVGTRGTLGVVGLAQGERNRELSPARRQLLETFVAQTALALERATLAEAAARATLAAETERTRNALLAAVSHDVRTPLATISATADLLLDPQAELTPGARTELLEGVREEAGRLNRLVANLLDLTRLEAGDFPLHIEPCPLEEIVGAALEHTRGRLRDRDIQVHLPAEMLVVAADPVLLEQVFVNLLENAGKYSPAGSPIEVRAHAAGDSIQVAVADHGPGIRPGEEERLFERFYRVTDGDRSLGTGLGLTVCRAILKAHHGRIWAENRPQGGAVFCFELPAYGGKTPTEVAKAAPLTPEKEAGA